MREMDWVGQHRAYGERRQAGMTGWDGHLGDGEVAARDEYSIRKWLEWSGEFEISRE